MENIFIKSINQNLMKYNFYDTISKIEKVYNKRISLTLYELDDLQKDLKNIRNFMMLNLIPVNLNNYKYYYKRFKHMENETIKLCFKKVNL